MQEKTVEVGFFFSSLIPFGASSLLFLFFFFLPFFSMHASSAKLFPSWPIRLQARAARIQLSVA